MNIRRPTRKSRRMKEVEQAIGRPLETAIPLMVTELGLSGAADYMGLSKATLQYWLLKFRIRVERVALGPYDRLDVYRHQSDVE